MKSFPEAIAIETEGEGKISFSFEVTVTVKSAQRDIWIFMYTGTERINAYMITVVVGKFSCQCQEMHWLVCEQTGLHIDRSGFKPWAEVIVL